MTDRPPPQFILPANLAIAHGRIDEQHRAIIGVLNRLRDRTADTVAAPPALRPLLTELFSAVDAHFADEETLMEEAGFSRLAEHRLSHQAIWRQMADLVASWPQDSPVRETDILSLYEFMIDDVLRADLPFKTYLEQRGLLDY
jgi:hemerythrin